MESDIINLKGLDQLIKALKQPAPKARIGILGDHATRRGGDSTNADIGAAHEYGAPGRGIPQRSFLRMPLTDNLEKEMENSGMILKANLKEILKAGSVISWVKSVAIIAENVVKEAFETGGFGKWPAWSNPRYTNNTGQLLVDTTQLRDSITSEVKE